MSVQKKTATKIVANIGSLFLGAIFALAAFYVVNDTGFLTADILQQGISQGSDADFLVDVEGQTVSIYANKDFGSLSSIEFLVDFGFDQERLAIVESSIESDFPLTHVLQPGMLSFLVSDIQSPVVDQTILRFTIDGDDASLVLENFRMFIQGEEEMVSVGLPEREQTDQGQEILHY